MRQRDYPGLCSAGMRSEQEGEQGQHMPPAPQVPRNLLCPGDGVRSASFEALQVGGSTKVLKQVTQLSSGRSRMRAAPELSLILTEHGGTCHITVLFGGHRPPACRPLNGVH